MQRPIPIVTDTAENYYGITLQPAPEILEWIKVHILDESGSLYNEDHAHLLDADIETMWASSGFTKQGRVVLGQCEQVAFRAGGWQKARQEQQMHEWFGRVPKFIITVSAGYCLECSDLEFCQLIEHELYHIAHATDDFGIPKYGDDGLPKLKLQGHDVEEFIGVVKRYGASEDVQKMVEAASEKPEIGRINIAKACGTCLLKLA